MDGSERTPLSDQQPAAATSLDPARWLDRHGDCLFRYGLARLGDAEAAEELVQETFLSALQGLPSFAGRASERTWLIGILRHKLADHCRRRRRQRPLGSPGAPGSLEDLFDERGRWRNKPPPLPPEPGAALERQEFWDTFQHCLTQLPARLAAAFALREVDGLSGEEVRELLGVSPNNLWVLLHRARLALGRCLDVHWFRASDPRE